MVTGWNRAMSADTISVSKIAVEFHCSSEWQMRLALIAVVLLSLTQCDGPDQLWRNSLETSQRRMAGATANRRRMALRAASHLPATFADECALHSGTAESQSNDLEHQAWVNGCAQVEKLGRWESVDQTSSSVGSLNGFVLVEGRAVFESGEYRLQSFW